MTPQKQLSECEKCGRKSEVVMLGQQCPFCDKLNPLQKEIEAFEKEFKCIAIQCDNKGTISNRIGEDEWEPEQCEYCYTVRFPLIEKYKQSLLRFTKSVIEQAMPEEKAKKTILIGDRQWDDGFNACRKQLKENMERILKHNDVM